MCFSLPWLESMLIDLVWLVAVVLILRLFVPWLLSMLGIGGSIIMQVINIVIWAVVLVFVIVLVFSLLGCLGDGHLSLLPRR